MLYFVSTPVGNLGDISYRAVEVLKSVDAIACEDTRTSLKLLNRYEIKKPLLAYHKFNEKQSCDKIIEMLLEGKNIAVITDAGTPVISDPGNVLSSVLKERGIEFTTIPGATAFVPALILSGFDVSRFAFIGFLPDKKSLAEDVIRKYKDLDLTLIFYCAPHDILRVVGLLHGVLGSRKCSAVKEITKIHERAINFTLGESFPEEEPKGEYVLIVEGCGEVVNPNAELPIVDHVKLYISQGMEKMDAIKKVARERGVSKSEIYKQVIDVE